MTAPTDADVERVLAEARWLARGGSAPAANKRVAAALIEAQAENARLREALKHLRSYGCPVCQGDCASANPPVTCCPMQEADTILGAST